MGQTGQTNDPAATAIPGTGDAPETGYKPPQTAAVPPTEEWTPESENLDGSSIEGAKFSLSTHATAPADIFEIDGTAYSLFSFKSFGREQEVKIRWLFTRHQNLQAKLGGIDPQHKNAEHTALTMSDQIRQTEVDMICQFTDVPPDMAKDLTFESRIVLFQHIAQELMGFIPRASDALAAAATGE